MENIQGSKINQKSNNTISVMLFTESTFVKKKSLLVARIVLFDAVGLHLVSYPSKDILKLIALL